MLGSGLGSVCSGWTVIRETPFDAIPGLSAEHVPGHEGVIKTCEIGGRTGLCVVGRKHWYEGSDRPVRALIDHIAGLGVSRLLLTSASGSLTRSIRPGEIGLAEDLIDLQFRPPAAPARKRAAPAPAAAAVPAPSSPVFGERPVVGMRAGLDPRFGNLVRRAAAAAGTTVRRGVMAAMMGPTYETPAEVGMLQAAGADFVTMSAAPEIEFAAARGMAVAALAVITNYATGISPARLTHEEVLLTGRAAAGQLRALIEQLVALK